MQDRITLAMYRLGAGAAFLTVVAVMLVGR